MSALSFSHPSGLSPAVQINASRTLTSVPSGRGGDFAGLLGNSAVNQPGTSAPLVHGLSRIARSETETRAAIHKSAIAFESTCLGQLMSFMTEAREVDPMFGGGRGEEMFRGMLTTEYGKLATKNSHTGIAAAVERQLLRAQGLQPLTKPNVRRA